MELFIVRHGESLSQIDVALDNQPDTPLSPLGETQAKAVATRLKMLAVSHIVSSPLLRALGTAAYITEAVGQPTFEVWPELCEGWTGGYQSFQRKELLRRFPAANLPDSMADSGWSHPGDQTYAMFCARAQGVLRRIEATFGHADRVVVVTHGGLGSLLLNTILQIPPATPQWFKLQNASITHVHLVPDSQQERWGGGYVLYPPVRAEVRAVNDTAHLRPCIEPGSGIASS
jgi:broad specificity phosphatase PhoE